MLWICQMFLYQVVELIFIYIQLFSDYKSHICAAKLGFPLALSLSLFFYFYLGFTIINIISWMKQPNLKEAFPLCCHTVWMLKGGLSSAHSRSKSKYKLWNSTLPSMYQYHRLQDLLSQTVRLILDTFKINIFVIIITGRTFLKITDL